MTCARGCCWTAFQVCARSQTCACHWEELRPTIQGDTAHTHRDPTARDAIRNVMNEKRKN